MHTTLQNAVRTILIVIVLGTVAPSHSAQEAPDLATEAQRSALEKTIGNCANCHGINGQSASPTFPNLAAQMAPYIELQLHAFKDQTRADPDAQAYMWGMASQLDDASITGLAAYFAKQPAAPGRSGNSSLIAQGKALFTHGLPERGIPACATCHGALAQGNLSAEAAAGHPERSADGTRDARRRQGFESRSDASGRGVLAIHLADRSAVEPGVGHPLLLALRLDCFKL